MFQRIFRNLMPAVGRVAAHTVETVPDVIDTTTDFVRTAATAFEIERRRIQALRAAWQHVREASRPEIPEQVPISQDQIDRMLAIVQPAPPAQPAGPAPRPTFYVAEEAA